MRADRPHIDVRRATHGDEPAIRALDDAAFPFDGPDGEPAKPGFLENGVANNVVWLAMAGDVPAGYLHALQDGDNGVLYISGVAVAPALQGQGVGSDLTELFLRETKPERDDGFCVVTVTSATNFPMMRLLLGKGFLGRWSLPDFFGPRRHRLGFLLAAQGTRQAQLGRQTVSVGDQDLLHSSLASGWILESLGQGTPASFNLRSADTPPPCQPPSISAFRPDLASEESSKASHKAEEHA